MSYPIDNNESLQEAVNDLLSGPSGLGQNFQGFSAYEPAFVRPTFRAPFTLPGDTTLNPSWYLDIPINNAVAINVDPGGFSQEVEFTFTTPQATAPFQYGDRVNVVGVTPDFYNDSYRVFSCSTTSVIIYTSGTYQWPAYVSGGSITRNFNNRAVSADNNARITVYGPTDQAFISSQIRLDVGYEASGNADFRVRNTIERWRGYPVQGTEDYTFAFDSIVSQQDEDFSVTSGTGSVPVEAIFTTVLDNPTFGYYWYFNNIYFLNLEGLVPSSGSYDQYAVQGVSPIAATGAYTNVMPQTVTGTGSGADLDLFIYNTAYDVIFTDPNDFAEINFEVTTVNSAGTGYAVGDTIRILGTDVGGTSPDNDIVLKINAVTNANSCYAGNVVVGMRSMTAQVIKH